MRFQKNRLSLQVYNKIEGFKAVHPVVTIGIFDGIHLGHVQILKRLKEISNQSGGETVVVTLWPHPRQVLGDKDTKVKLLSTLEEKTELIKRAGMDHLIILPFTQKFANITFSEFIKNYLVKGINASHIVVGYNHHFGKDRKGGFEQLVENAVQFNFSVERLDPVIISDTQVSSSAIRQLISEGNIALGNRLLGYMYSLSGKVIEGKKLGRILGFPTANIHVTDENKLIPALGVYAVLVESEDHTYRGMLNIGYRPTLKEQIHQFTIEVHIFDFDKNIYGNEVKITFIERIRSEKKFENADGLIHQLKEDQKSSNEIFARFSL